LAYIGGSNPIPRQVGGGKALVERIYWAMRAAVGEGNYAVETPPASTIEGAWRWARAQALASAQADERAVMQMYPDRATDMIEVYEEILGITAPSASSDEERRQEIVRRWVLAVTAVQEELEDELQLIDPLFSIIYSSYDASDTTEAGRAFEDYLPADPAASGPPFNGGRSSTDWPNYSADFIVIVLYDIGAGVLSAEQLRRVEQAKEVLNRALPAWVAFSIIVNPTGGFILDQSPLDFGTFNP
jgi:hypothetical protein